MSIKKSSVNSCQRFEESRSRSMRYQNTQYSLGLGASASTSRKRLIRRGAESLSFCSMWVHLPCLPITHVTKNRYSTYKKGKEK